MAVSIMTAKETVERPGWQRGTDFDEASLRRTIMNLQEENENLKQELKEVNKAAIQNVAFENYDVKLDYYYTTNNNYSSRRVEGCIERKLPEVFKVIATQMMDVSLTELAITDAIKSKFISVSGSRVYINDSQQIKIILNQLRVLDLIKSSWDDTTSTLYWGLTKKGRMLRDDMIVKKESMLNENSDK